MNVRPFLLLSLIFSLASTAFSFQNNAPFFTTYPTLTTDGQAIIFSYESDLWQVPAEGGTAIRLTAMDGAETRPSVSPDIYVESSFKDRLEEDPQLQRAIQHILQELNQ